MPELPEVETVRRGLAPVLVGARIEQIFTAGNSYFFVTPPRTLKAHLLGRGVNDLVRHGKYLVAQLDDGSRLLLHLGMTGQFVAKQLPRDEHVHMELSLSNQQHITFRDVRKFGKVEWIAKGKESKRLTKLGPDALVADSDWLRKKFKVRKIPIKTALLDQGIWAGVGNIYADEGLYRSRINPNKQSSSLTRQQVETLRAHIQKLLEQAILSGGSTINNYLKPDGKLGGFQDFHQVYGKTGAPCPECGQLIIRITLGGRGTHFCARCQK